MKKSLYPVHTIAFHDLSLLILVCTKCCMYTLLKLNEMQTISMGWEESAE